MQDLKYVSAMEYSRRTGMGVETVKDLCRKGKLKHQMTKGGYYKIQLDDEDTVPRNLYEETLQRAVRAETKLESIQAVLN